MSFYKNYGIIYKITSSSGKSYIGQTIMIDSKGKSRDHMTRFEEHCKEAYNNQSGCVILNNAIRKYPKDSFQVEKITICHVHILDMYETFCIKFYNTLEPNGYNVREGGSNGRHSLLSRKRMSLSKMGNNNHNFGKPRSTKTKKAISDAKHGKKHHFYGKNLTQVHKKALSNVRKKYDKSLPMYMCYVKARPTHYCSEGYAICNHPNGKRKYFTSSKLTLEQKYNLAFKYLTELDNRNAVQRLNVSGLEKD